MIQPHTLRCWRCGRPPKASGHRDWMGRRSCRLSSLVQCVQVPQLMARVERVVFGAEDPKAGSLGTLYNLGADPRLNHEFEVQPRVLEQDCSTLLQRFFLDKR